MSVLAGTEHETLVSQLASEIVKEAMRDKMQTSWPFVESSVKAGVDDFIDELRAAIDNETVVQPD